MDTEAKIHEFIYLRATGISYEKISQQIDVSKPTLLKWSRLYSLELQNMKNFLLDDLKAEISFKREKRIRLLALLAEKFETELLTRDFKDIPTDKLISLMHDTHSKIQTETSVEFSEKVEFDFTETNLETKKWSA